jgi:hypothetical protein
MLYCRFTAKLEIIFPERTFRPRRYFVDVAAVSEAGARLFCRTLDAEDLTLLLKDLRYAKLEWGGGERDKRVLHGKILWLEERDDKSVLLGFAIGEDNFDLETLRQALFGEARANPAPAESRPVNLEAMPAGAKTGPTSSWAAAMRSMSGLFQRKVGSEAEERAVAENAGPGQEQRRVTRHACLFDAHFQLHTRNAMQSELLQGAVVDVSWLGSRLRVRSRDFKTALSVMEGSPEISRAELCRKAYGWLMVSRRSVKLSLAGRVVWLGPETLAGSLREAFIDIGLAFEGEEEETKHARLALLELADANPPPPPPSPADTRTSPPTTPRDTQTRPNPWDTQSRTKY